ncbi:MAG: hypothetical protein ACI9EF_002219 [Pseudohongiellaceae bacterium]|jgi:hypothetical protein
MLRTDVDLSMYDVPFRTDALGLRCRPGTRNSKKEPEDALRIVVVGASIPFGIALEAEQVTAHILERLLQERSLPSAGVDAGGRARPIVCRTVAVPRWGHRNAVSFLLDHWDELRPDIVIYMPVGNDTSDTLIVDESEHRRDWPDSLSRYPKITVSDNATVQLLSYADLLHRTRGDALPGEIVGAHALRADLGQESQ